MDVSRKCTRCRDTDGNPTGVVLGGECFLCQGAGAYVRTTVDRRTREAGQRRADAIGALSAAGITYKQAEARRCLETRSPERHDKLVESVLAGRVADVLRGLDAYIDEAQI